MLSVRQEKGEPREPSFGTLPISSLVTVQLGWVARSGILCLRLWACAGLFSVNLPGPATSHFACSVRVLSSCSGASPSAGEVLADRAPRPGRVEMSAPPARTSAAWDSAPPSAGSWRVEGKLYTYMWAWHIVLKACSSLSPTPAPFSRVHGGGGPGSLALCGSAGLESARGRGCQGGQPVSSP